MTKRPLPHFVKPRDFDGESSSSSRSKQKLVFEERTGSTESHDPSIEGSSQPVVFNNPYASLSIQQQRSRLPIFRNRNQILYLLEKYQTVVIVGETGSGKSTQLPQYLVETGWAYDNKKICVTQPRRVSAITLAQRVAEERMTLLGNDVGYVVRFDECCSERAPIKFVTDGILVREIMRDPLLNDYSVIMVDEAHERTIYTDIIIGLLRKIIVKRPDLRIIISSATIDAELFRDFFNHNETKDPQKDTSTIISVEGRTYPVKIFYKKNPVADYLRETVNTVLKIHKLEAEGDILAFLTGQDEVESVCQMLRNESSQLKKYDRLWVLPMYGGLPFREQMKVFESSPAGTRKIIVATNIAEASVTIPGITYVIDCGFMKLRALKPETGIESLMVVPISQASAEQRAGRAGRLKPGRAYRLYPEEEYVKLMPASVPEVQRSHMAPIILQMKALGIDNILRFHYLSRPPASSTIRGLELLYALGAIDQEGHLVKPLGEQMAEFPLPPMHAKALLVSHEFDCSVEMLTVIAMLQIQNVFVFPIGQKHKAELMKRKFSVEEGDHLTMLNIYTNFENNKKSQKWCADHYLNYRGLIRASEIWAQLSRFLQKYKIPMKSCREVIGMDFADRIRRCLVAGFFNNAAKLHHTGVYKTVRENYTLKIYMGSALMYRKNYPEWVIYNEVLQDSMRDITVIEPEWLYELAPHFYEFGTDAEIAAKRSKSDQTT